MKVRLYRGPFDGKVIKDWDGRRELYVAGPKKLSRKERMKQWKQYNNAAPWNDTITMSHVSALYIATNFVHPDGSVFYEWNQPRPPRHS